MREMTKKEQMNAVGGADKHWHWFCSVNRFTSDKHETKAIAAYYCGRHVGRYPDHEKKYQLVLVPIAGKLRKKLNLYLCIPD